MGPDFPCSQIRLPKRRIFAFPECGKNPKRKIPPGSGKSLFSSEPQKQHFRGRGSRQIFPMETEQCSSAKAADPGAGIAPGNAKGKQPGQRSGCFCIFEKDSNPRALGDMPGHIAARGGLPRRAGRILLSCHISTPAFIQQAGAFYTDRFSIFRVFLI